MVISPSTSVSPQSDQSRIAAIVGFLVVTEFASGLTQGWINPLLPSFIARYDLSTASANWITSVALLSTVVLVPLLSKLGDLYGHKRMLTVAAGLVAIGSVLVAIAPNFFVLLIGRVLQGAITAFLALEFAIVRERAGHRAGQAIGMLIGSLTIGASLGMLFAGMAREHLGLSTSLWIPAGLMTVVTVLMIPLVPETVVRKTGGVDWLGAVLLGGGLVLFLGAIGNGARWGWLDARTVIGIVGGIIVLAIWVRVEERSADPLVQLDLVKRKDQGLPLLTAFVFGTHLFGSAAPAAVFLGLNSSTSGGHGLNLTGTALGAALLVLSATMFVGTVVAARLRALIGGTATMVIGSALSAASYLATAAFHSDLSVFLVWQAGLGLGGGLVAAVLPTIVVERAPADSVGIASGLYNTTRTAAGSVTGAVFATVMTSLVIAAPSRAGHTGSIASESAFVVVWIICAVLAVIVAGLAVATGRSGNQSS